MNLINFFFLLLKFGKVTNFPFVQQHSHSAYPNLLSPNRNSATESYKVLKVQEKQ